MSGDKEEIMDEVKPVFHITGGKGWINDPNGLIKINDEYHVFFQYYPHATHWGPMHWGHVKSKNLTEWKRLPVALYPDENDDGCFSGSAVDFCGKLYLVYTSHKDGKNGNPVREEQAIASSSDLVHFEKHGIIIGENLLPEEYSSSDFRDPKIFKRGDKFYCVAAARRKGGNGRLLLFSSADLFTWSFVTDLFGKDGCGQMTECPCYYDELGLLMWSDIPEENSGNNNHRTFYTFGSLSESGFVSENFIEPIDYGFDFYAPQVFYNQPVLIGWMYSFDCVVPYEKYGYCGMLTVPRLIEKRNGRLWQTPIVNGTEDRDFSGEIFSGELKAGVLHFEIENMKGFFAKLKVSSAGYASLTFENGMAVFDRSNCSEKICGTERDKDSENGIRKMPVNLEKTSIIDIAVDLFSIEIFVNGRALSSVVCNGLNADKYDINVVSDGCKLTVKRLK